MALVAFAPTLFNVLFLADKWVGDTVKLAALLVVLPRLFMILNFTYDLLQQIFSWSTQKARLEGLENRLNLDEQPVAGHVNPNKITINRALAKGDVLGEIMSRCQSPCRLTIEGENGSGKSTLLLKIKYALKDKAHYVSPHGEGSFLRATFQKSTGEQMYEMFLKLSRIIPHGTILLLDEWSANLDSDNRKKISDLLDQLSKQLCVVEEVHRHSDQI